MAQEYNCGARAGMDACGGECSAAQNRICINGAFSGNLKSKGSIRVNQSSLVEGDLTAECIEIFGRLIGDAKALKHLTIGSAGSVQGNVETPSLSIVEGGVLDGFWKVLVQEEIEPDPSGADREDTGNSTDPTPSNDSPGKIGESKNKNTRSDQFAMLGLTGNPFSNTSGPEFFHPSKDQLKVLKDLTSSICLQPGLHLVLGEAGTGKSTLCRKFASQKDENQDERYLLPSPQFSSPPEFLSSISNLLGIRRTGISQSVSEEEIKSAVKNHLRRRWMDKRRNTILIIDEGQTMDSFCKGFLAELLSLASDDSALFHIVVFAQQEFGQSLQADPEFSNFLKSVHHLKPMDIKQVRAMIQHRLDLAKASRKAPSLFSFPALYAVHQLTGGYPKQVIQLCHGILLLLLSHNQTRASWSFVKSSAKMLSTVYPKNWKVK
jgi:type II secretory pathway predicted ATPase ExeA/cytoskeletal protein CcmA (bactofilin family)